MDAEQQLSEVDSDYIERHISSASKPVTTMVIDFPADCSTEVIDFLAESLSAPLTGAERAQRCRFRKQASKKFVSCMTCIYTQQFTDCPHCGCGKPLVDKNGNLRGTDDPAKAICRECKVKIKERATEERCKHLRARSFTFSDGKTITLCPDCTKFDNKRYQFLNSRKPFGEHSKTIVAIKRDAVSGRALSRRQQRVKDRYDNGRLLPSARSSPPLATGVAWPAQSERHDYQFNRARDSEGAIRPITDEGFRCVIQNNNFALPSSSGPCCFLHRVIQRDITNYVVVPLPCTKLKPRGHVSANFESMKGSDPLIEWEELRDERDHERFACVYVSDTLYRHTPSRATSREEEPGDVTCFSPSDVKTYEDVDHIVALLGDVVS